MAGPNDLPLPGTPEALMGGLGQPVAFQRATELAMTSAPKQDAVASAAQLKQLSLGGPAQIRRISTAMTEGNGLVQNDEDLRVLTQGSSYEIVERFGPEGLQLAAQIFRQRDRDENIRNQDRSLGEIAGDSALGITAGALAGLGGIGALGAGLVSDEAGAAVSGVVGSGVDALRGWQSSELQGQRELAQVRRELDQEDINAQYERDLADGKSFAGLRRFGREVLSAGADLVQNPALAGDLVSEGVGSLVAGGALGRVAALGGARYLLKQRGITGANATAFLRSEDGRRMVSELAVKGMPAAIGGLEAGGAYVGIQSEIQSMDEQDLLENSPEYRGLRAQGMGHEEARDEIANMAALQGGAISGLFGAATGRFVAKFEANPLGVGAGSTDFVSSLRSLGREALVQGLEEGGQGVVGGLAQDQAIQQYADENREIGVGLGMDAIQGAVAGVGMVGALAAPGALVRGTAAALDLGTQGAKAVGEAVSTAANERLKRQDRALENESPVGKDAVASVGTTLAEGLRTLKETAGTAAQTSTEPLTQERMVEIGEKANALLDLSPETIADVVQQFDEGKMSPQDEADTALDIFQRVTEFDKITTQELAAVNPEMRKALRDTRKAVDTLLSNPAVNRALERAQKLTSQEAFGELPEITEENLSSPEVGKAVKNTVALALANPAGVDARFVKQVLNQRRRLKLSDELKARLEAAAAIATEMKKADEAKARNAEATAAELKRRGISEKPRKPWNIVREEIRDIGGKSEWKQYSLSKHQSEIVSAVERGDLVYAQERMDALRNFGEHMNNKLAAAEQSAALKRNKDNKIPYRTWTGESWIEADKASANSIFINPFSPTNVQLLKDIRVDASTVQSLYNNLLTIYGPLFNLKGEAFTDAQAKAVAPATAAEPEAAEKASENKTKGETGADQVKAETREGRAEGQAEARPQEAAAEQDGSGADEGNRGEGDGGTGQDAGTGRDNAVGGSTGGEPEAGADPEPVIEDLAQQDEQNIRGKFNTLLDNAGLPDWLSKRVKMGKGKRPSTYHKDGSYAFARSQIGRPMIVFSQRFLDDLGNPEKADRIEHVLMHELGHLVDRVFSSAAENGVHLSDSKAFDKKGLIRKELAKQLPEYPALKEFFEKYSLSQPDNEDFTRRELFAELFAMFVREPLGLKEALPNTHAWMQETMRVEFDLSPEGDVNGQETGDADGPDGSGAGSAADVEGVARGPEEVLKFERLPAIGGDAPKFVETFAVDPAKAPLMVEEYPAIKALEMLDGELPVFLDQGQVRAWKNLIKTEGKALIDKVNLKLQRPFKQLDGKTPLQLMRESIEGKGKYNWLEVRATMGLNLVDVTRDQYDATLLQSAMLAAIHWVMNTPAEQNQDDEDIAKFFGTTVDLVTEQMRHAVNNGRGVKQSVESLAQTIMDFWGASAKPDAPISDIRGMSEHMAIQFLDAMQGIFTVEKEFTVVDANGVEKKPRVIYLKNPATADKMKSMRGSKNLLGRMFAPEAVRMFHIGTPPESSRQTQKGNALSPLGDKMQQALKVQREAPFFRNGPQMNMMKALGQDTWAELMGYRAINEGRMNVVHRQSIEGLNNSIMYSWDNVMEYDAQLEAYAKSEGLNPDEVPGFGDFYAASNERMMVDGFSQQADKGFREAALKTWSVLDLTDEAQHDAFWLTVAQSIGIKTEKGTRVTNAAKADEEIRAKFSQSIEILKDWLGDETQPLDVQKRKAMTAEIREALKGERATPKLMHALLSVARYDRLMDNAVPGSPEFEEIRSFRHALALEADGKTDGPIHAINHYSVGPFTQEWVTSMRRGGVFLNEEGTTLNQQLAQDGADLYEVSAIGANQEFAERVKKISRSSDGQRVVSALKRVIGILGEVKIGSDGNIQITRAGIKNPLTISGYGSGENGIAGKVTALMLDKLYAGLTALEEARVEFDDPSITLDSVMPEIGNLDQFKKDLDFLTHYRIAFDRQSKEWVADPVNTRGQRPKKLMDLDKAVEFKILPDQFLMLQENVKTVYVKPMRAAIGKVFGEAEGVLGKMQKATQIQSMVLRDIFFKELKATLAEKRETGELKPGAFLSEKDYRNIFKKLKKYGAFIESVRDDEHSINLSVAERGDTTYDFSRDFDGRYGGTSTLPAPRLAGVSARPQMTISRGDGQMMINFYGDEGAVEAGAQRTEGVFDGLEMPADLIDSLSQRINKAVSDAMLENPLVDVAEGFRDWIRQGKDGPLALLSVETLGEIGAMFDQEAKVEDIAPHLDQLAKSLEMDALSAQARKNVLKRVKFTNDHMASAESPYVHDGETWNGEGTLVGWLNTLYTAELGKLAAERKDLTLPTPVEPYSNELGKKLRKAGLKVKVKVDGKPQQVVTRMSVAEMVAFMDDASVPAAKRDMIRELGKIMPDFTFMLGSKEALMDWRAETYPDLQDMPEIDLGQTDNGLGVIFIANLSAETVLHEMWHGALGKTFTDYYANIGDLSDVQKAAIRNLETLMAQFHDMDFSLETGPVAETAQTLQREIRSWLGENLEDLRVSEDEADDMLVLRRSAALGEFVSWTLSNQNLEAVLSTSKVRSKLARLKDHVIKVVRKLFGLPEKISTDVLSNIRWNAGALVHTLKAAERQRDRDGMVLNQALSLNDTRLAQMRRMFQDKVTDHLQKLKTSQGLAERKDIDALANDALHRFEAFGFEFTPEQAHTFQVLQAGFASSMKVAPGVMAQAQRLFQHLLSQLRVEDFMVDEKDDTERPAALDKFNVIVGKTGTETDRFGRSNLMSSVMALAVVDEDFRNMLARVKLPQRTKVSYASTDAFLESVGGVMMDVLSSAVSQQRRGLKNVQNQNVRDALDELNGVIAQIETDRRSWAERKTYELLDKGDEKIQDVMEGLGKRMHAWGSRNRTPKTGRLLGAVNELMRNSARVMAGVISEERGGTMAEALLSYANQVTSAAVPTAFKELIAEAIGTTDGNKNVLSLVNKVKAEVSGVRQDYREKMPKIFAEQFKEELTNEEYSALHLGMGRADLAVLGENHSAAEIRDFLLDQRKLDDKVSVLEEEITGPNRTAGRKMLRKADELARFMVTGEIDPANHNLLKNAYAIANLFGETRKAGATSYGPTDDLVKALDQYTTLRALEILKAEKPAEWARMERVAKEESAGFDFLLYSLLDLRKTEVARLNSPASLANAWKGYVPEEVSDGARLMVANDLEYAKLSKLGFTRIGDYEGSGYEKGQMGYYYSNVGGKSPYAQGVMQTIQRTAMGVDPINGRNMSNMTGGVISGRQVIAIQTMMQSQGGNSTGEALIPIYDGKGRVVAYERSLKPAMRERLPRNTHLGQMMGAWAGRQQEEMLAQAYNEQLIDELKKVWDRDRRQGRKKEFVDLSKISKDDDEVWADTWNMIPPETKAYIEQVFGTDGFMVRKDMINNALGYRVPSVKDFWEGPSRLDPKVRATVRNAVQLIVGKNGLKMATTAEKLWGAGISMVKNTIVVRSIIVPASNMASNVMQLMAAGVSLRDIATKLPAKLLEIDQYLKNRDREIELKTLMARYRDDNLRMMKYAAELKSLEDANMRMSIWPMIQAGEFSTIAEGETETNAAISEGRWSEYVQNIMDRVPAKLGTVGRYAMITRDTALFRAMSRAVQYGDFLARSVMYDHLIENEKLNQDEAKLRVMNEFVPYNHLPGRMRSYMENMGITWFWAYKIRSMKVALNMLRRNPLRALLMSYGAEYLPSMPGVSVGSPLSDNAANVILEGRADYAIGLDMLWSGMSLNPWVNLTN